MQVQLGNQHPKLASLTDSSPTVTYINIPDSYTVTSANATDIASKFSSDPDITKLAEHEAFVAVVHNSGVWQTHGYGNPIWVWSDNPILQKQLQDFYGVGDRPSDYESTHYTLNKVPGGEQI